ncbi:VCBS repeat-containing protein [Candidatus Sumerlaeota bacterium]|nr:VCBS repeat-containing protein [Candidatus Sumerlaeota bacterium]
MPFRLSMIFFSIFMILRQTFPANPYLEISRRFEENDPACSSVMNLFIRDVRNDSRCEIIIQNNYRIAVFEISPEKKSLNQIQQIRLSPVGLGQSPHYFCLGRLEPDEKDSLLIMTSQALYKMNMSLPGDDVATSPEKIMECHPTYPTETAGTRISHLDFALDLDGDGYDELLLPGEDGFSIYRKNRKGISEIAAPGVKANESVSFQADPSHVYYWNSRSVILEISGSGESGLKSLIYHPVSSGEKGKDAIHIYHARAPLSFQSEPDQEIAFVKRSSPEAYNSFQMILDIDRDGYMDVMSGESNFDILSPLTILRFYKAPSVKKVILEKPDQEIRLKDADGIFYFDDYSGDGYLDFCLVTFDYNPSSTDDVVEFFVNNNTRYRLDFHYYDPKTSRYSSIPNASHPIRIKHSAYIHGGTRDLINLKGDFNGDGRKDVMALTNGDRGEIYLRNPKGIERKPYCGFNAHNALALDICDVDGNGKDDIVLMSVKEKTLSVYLFR